MAELFFALGWITYAILISAAIIEMVANALRSLFMGLGRD